MKETGRPQFGKTTPPLTGLDSSTAGLSAELKYTPMWENFLTVSRRTVNRFLVRLGERPHPRETGRNPARVGRGVMA